MSKLTKLILNIVVIAFYTVALVSFFTDFIYVWILGIGKVGSYKGYEVALNFDGMPTNLATLGPLLLILGSLIYAIVILIKRIINYNKPPKELKSSVIRPLMIAIIFVMLPITSMFLCLSTFDILQLPAPKRYGGYYMAVGPYLAAYFPLVGGLMFFIIQSGIFPEKVEPAKAAHKKITKQAPKAEAPKAQAKAAAPAQPAKPAQPQANPVAPQAKVAPQVAKTAPQKVAPQVTKPVEPARPVAQANKAIVKPTQAAKPSVQVKPSAPIKQQVKK